MSIDNETNLELQETEQKDIKLDTDNLAYETQGSGGPYHYQTLDSFVYKEFNICVPVSITPYAEAGMPIITSLDPIGVFSGHNPCEYDTGTCHFTICQSFCVKVPVKYGMTTTYGDTCTREETVLDSRCS